MAPRPTRRSLLRGLAFAGAGGPLAGCSSLPDFGSPQENGPIPEGPTVALEPVAEGLTAPVGFAVADEDRDRRFVADQIGLVRVHGPNGLREKPFLDLRDEITGFGEQGLLGLAFHPNFAENGRLFVRYSAPLREGTPEEYSHTFVLSEFRADENRKAADSESERTVLEIPQPQRNHNAGAVAFGSDGFLYVATGDGGGANDVGTGHVDDWYDENAGGNGQDVTETLLGGILRIDVDSEALRVSGVGGDDADAAGEDDAPYAIPDDNPLVGEDGLDEYFAWGLRNPWRFSFDGDGRLFVADAGQELFEEVNLVERGGNYGWNVREGSRCFSPDSPGDPPEDCPDETPEAVRGGDTLVDPIIDYPHQAAGERIGSSVVGGHVAETDHVPDLEGTYVFGDFSASFGEPSGSLFAATPPDDGGQWSMKRLVPADGPLERFVLSFGRDRDGRLYVLTTRQLAPDGESGVVYRIDSAEGDGASSDGGETTGDEETEAGDADEGSASGGQSGFDPMGAVAGLLAGVGWVRGRKKR
ncbi:PQQ-dependent sugar dehydrogenase [Halostella pelagica]|uniref:PQQ-dependent sugar dehydrogenase n=1 Tax=Halostella pelagica TaxID=2583824 RepID=UPI001081466A|nr:PQQ-dependent sugar dehydrogenase [Halostella pelagica]